MAGRSAQLLRVEMGTPASAYKAPPNNTLRDAVVVAFKLDIHYLWVDILCIIQDDAVDMANEMSQVALIYSSALVTIAASSARTVDEGFLRMRDAGCPPHLMLELPCETENGELGSVCCCREAWV